MRIVLVGAVDFSLHCLEEIVQAKGNVVGVVTLSAIDGAGHSDYADLSKTSQHLNIPVLYLRNVNAEESLDAIRSLHPDVIFVLGWSHLVGADFLAIPPMGCVGVHPALLPKNRGRHPLIWALVEGLDESGLTFFYLDEGADTGDILWQQTFPITLEDDAGTLYEKIKTLASKAISKFLPQLSASSAPRTPQDHSQASYWRKRSEDDGEIDWSASSLKSHNLIRALAHPYPGAHTFIDGRKIVIWKSRLPEGAAAASWAHLPPGTIVDEVSGALLVRTGDGQLEIMDCGIKPAVGQQFEHSAPAPVPTGPAGKPMTNKAG
jgi:methionyl-tRNA formyltransferase